MKAVFMGTPEFALPCLDALLAAGHTASGVFTQPDKPKGRGYALTPPPVKIRAEELGLPVYQPAGVRDGSALEILRSLSPDIIVVVAYGKILPEEILRLPRYGCLNVHASLLPRHRGASPIQWAIVSGDRESGVTTMRMDIGMDTGDIYETAALPIGEEETAEQLHDRLSALGAKLLVSTLSGLEAGNLSPHPQPEEGVTYAPIIKKEMGLLDFTKPAAELYNLVRGFYPWPGTYTFLEGKRLRVLSARVAAEAGEAGRLTLSDGRMLVGCKEGSLELLEIQPEGKKRMPAAAFLQGCHLANGTKLG